MEEVNKRNIRENSKSPSHAQSPFIVERYDKKKFGVLESKKEIWIIKKSQTKPNNSPFLDENRKV